MERTFTGQSFAELSARQRAGWRRSSRSLSNGQFSRIAAASAQQIIDIHRGVERWCESRKQLPEKFAILHIPANEDLLARFSKPTLVPISALVHN